MGILREHNITFIQDALRKNKKYKNILKGRTRGWPYNVSLNKKAWAMYNIEYLKIQN